MRSASLLVSILLAGGCATAPKPPSEGERELNAADAASPVQVANGQVLLVPLAANPGTGYAWAWDEAAAAGVLARDGEPSMAGTDPRLVGGGGTQTWRFRAVKAGDGELRLDYRRPWEKDTPPVQTVRWSIQVR